MSNEKREIVAAVIRQSLGHSRTTCLLVSDEILLELFKHDHQALPSQPPSETPHATDGAPCWCNPEVIHVEGKRRGR